MRSVLTPEKIAAMTENDVHILSAIMVVQATTGKSEIEFGDEEHALVSGYVQMIERHLAMFPRQEVPNARPT